MLEEFRPVQHLPKSLETERVLIRQWRVEDWEEHEALYDENASDHLAPWLPEQRLPRSLSEKRRHARDRILIALERWEQGTDYRFFIIRKPDNVIVGQIGITGIVRNVNQSGFIGYWIGKRFLNEGYATAATVLALQYGFEFLKLHRISLWISPSNLPSRRIAQKLGLRHEGMIKGALHLGCGWQDTEIYAILAEEWEERKATLMALFL